MELWEREFQGSPDQKGGGQGQGGSRGTGGFLGPPEQEIDQESTVVFCRGHALQL